MRNSGSRRDKRDTQDVVAVMTEQEWHESTNGPAMVAFIHKATTSVRTRWLGWILAKRFSVTDRQIHLVQVACCERVADLIPFPRLRECLAQSRLDKVQVLGRIRMLERLFSPIQLPEVPDLIGPFLNLSSPQGFAITAVCRVFLGTGDPSEVLRLTAAAGAARESDPAMIEARLPVELEYQSQVVREVIGNPFRPCVVEPHWLTAQDGAALRLAQGIRESWDFGDLPILGDALEDAGCTEDQILAHCRAAGPHVPGCWVIEALSLAERSGGGG